MSEEEFMDAKNWRLFLEKKQIPCIPEDKLLAVVEEYNQLARIAAGHLYCPLEEVSARFLDTIIHRYMEFFPAHLQLETYAQLFDQTILWVSLASYERNIFSDEAVSHMRCILNLWKKREKL